MFIQVEKVQKNTDIYLWYLQFVKLQNLFKESHLAAYNTNELCFSLSQFPTNTKTNTHSFFLNKGTFLCFLLFVKLTEILKNLKHNSDVDHHGDINIR